MPNIGIIRQSVQLSWENIRSNKMRTLLTTLGIIIGVTAVISLITIVNGAISTVMDEFSSRANVHFIPGESLMDDPCGIYCDGLHLSTYAQVLLGIRLAERMRPFLPK